MSSRHEVYHRLCKGWTVAIDRHRCARCAAEIPPVILAQAKSRPSSA
jgi:hypothetical protein